MAVNTQFSIAVHLMAGLGYNCGKEMTSAHLALSINTSPSFVRRTLARLAKAGLVHTARGKTGACQLAKKPAEISLLDIYRAVNAPRAFAIHAYAEEKQCPVSCQIKASLEKALEKVQKSMEVSLDKISLAEVLADIRK